MIETPYYESHCLVLEPGDAVMYLGCIADHWREGKTGILENLILSSSCIMLELLGGVGMRFSDRREELYKTVDALTRSNILKKEYYELR